MKTNEPFKATELWHKLVTHLKSNVTQKRRRYKIKQYDDCFTGENAVDVIYDCLHQEKTTSRLITNEITRNVAVKVCQALMDKDIIEVVGAKSSRSSSIGVFEDSSTKFYQFSHQQKGDFALKNYKDPIDNGDTDTSRFRNLKTNQTHSAAPMDVMTVEDTNGWFNRLTLFQKPSEDSEDCSPLIIKKSQLQERCILRRDSNLPSPRQWHPRPGSAVIVGDSLKIFGTELKENVPVNSSEPPGKPSLVKFRKILSRSDPNLQTSFTEDHLLSTVDEDKIWKEVALSRLLPLVDLPFLEDILPSPKRVCLQKSDYQSVIPNQALLAKLDVTSKSENLWIRMAQDITESRCFFLDNPIGLTDGELKVQAMEKILRYYCNLPSPMIPTSLCKVFIAILGHVKDGRFALATHAFQFAVLLLPWQQRKELEKLFKFMKLAAEDESVRLKTKLNNRQYILQKFTSIIIHYELLGHEQALILVSFILHNQAIIFSPPSEIQTEVEKIILDSRLTGTTTTPAAINYCQQLSSKAFDEQTKSASQSALLDLMNSVLDSYAMTLKDKERWMKKFKKCHGDIYDENYQGDI